MLLDRYNSQGLLAITSVLGAASGKGKYAFRGDLVLKEGELREGSDRDRKPPEAVIRQAVILAGEDKLLFVGGLLSELEKLELFAGKYREALTPETLLLFYVEDIGRPLKVDYAGCGFNLLPYGDGMIWNELLDLLYIEKSELKGLSAEDKVATMFEAARGFDVKTAAIGFDEARGMTVEVVRDLAAGPV
ncbi:MAG: hypothetical protein ACU826_11770 [Gammaproteobacteria bacterium]